MLKLLYISVGCIQVCVFTACCYEVWDTFQVGWYTETSHEDFIAYAKRFAWISGFFFTLVTILLLVSYLTLNSVIKRCGGFPTGELLTTMRILFAIFFLSYLIRTFYQYMDGSWWKIIPEARTRQLLYLSVAPFFDIPSIGAILYVHYKNFTQQEAEKLKSSMLDETVYDVEEETSHKESLAVTDEEDRMNSLVAPQRRVS